MFLVIRKDKIIKFYIKNRIIKIRGMQLIIFKGQNFKIC